MRLIDADKIKYDDIPIANARGIVVTRKAVMQRAIEDMPTIEWIPVNERLPKEKGLYLVSVKNDYNRKYSKTCWFHGKGNWFSRQDVIAWMPLLEPYKESEE